MADVQTIRIQGLEQVQAALTRAPSVIVARLFAQALQKAINVIRDEVEAYCPVGEDNELHEQIIAAIQIDLIAKGGSAAVGFSHKLDPRTGAPFDLIALWVEYGHRLVGHKPNKKELGTVAGKGFMRSAFTASADRALAVFTDEMTKGIEGLGDL